MTDTERAELEARWLDLTRRVLPVLATQDWPVDQDHCFQRICLDHACGGVWYDHVDGRPAYRHASDDILGQAIRIAEDIRDGRAPLDELNRQSKTWRVERKRRSS